VTSCPPMTSVTNDTTRIRRLPPEYGVETKRMPKIDLAALLVATGAHAPFVGFIPREVMDRSRATRRGFPRYEPPTFARFFAAARFRYPGLFTQLRLLVMLEMLACGVPYDGIVRAEPPADERFMTTPPVRAAHGDDEKVHLPLASRCSCGGPFADPPHRASHDEPPPA
jgi:hypothetical protein